MNRCPSFSTGVSSFVTLSRLILAGSGVVAGKGVLAVFTGGVVDGGNRVLDVPSRCRGSHSNRSKSAPKRTNRTNITNSCNNIISVRTVRRVRKALRISLHKRGKNSKKGKTAKTGKLENTEKRGTISSCVGYEEDKRSNRRKKAKVPKNGKNSNNPNNPKNIFCLFHVGGRIKRKLCDFRTTNKVNKGNKDPNIKNRKKSNNRKKDKSNPYKNNRKNPSNPSNPSNRPNESKRGTTRNDTVMESVSLRISVELTSAKMVPRSWWNGCPVPIMFGRIVTIFSSDFRPAKGIGGRNVSLRIRVGGLQRRLQLMVRNPRSANSTLGRYLRGTTLGDVVTIITTSFVKVKTDTAATT